MPTDTEIWIAACERVGAFDKDNNPSISTHYYPAIGDPAAVVKLIDYWRHHSTTRPTWLDWDNWYWDNWKIELASAVLAVPQETQP